MGSTRAWNALFLGIGIGVVIALVTVTTVVGRRPGGRLSDFLSSLHIDNQQPTVVREIQQLDRLETVVYSAEKLITGQRESRYVPTFLIGDRLLLIVHGEVTAGVDMRKIQSSDVHVDGRSVRLTLPAAEIFSTRVDNQRTRVYSRDTGVFSSVDPQLESEVRRTGEMEIREAAMQEGIVQTAESNARAALSALLKNFGFEHVEMIERN